MSSGAARAAVAASRGIAARGSSSTMNTRVRIPELVLRRAASLLSAFVSTSPFKPSVSVIVSILHFAAKRRKYARRSTGSEMRTRAIISCVRVASRCECVALTLAAAAAARSLCFRAFKGRSHLPSAGATLAHSRCVTPKADAGTHAASRRVVSVHVASRL